MHIYLVRHGQTEENIAQILQGHMPGTLIAPCHRDDTQTNYPLSDCGLQRMYFQETTPLSNAEIRILTI